MRSLGTLVFLEAARAFDATLAPLPPSALLELTVLKDKPSVPLAMLADGGEPPAADIVQVQKLVSLARV